MRSRRKTIRTRRNAIAKHTCKRNNIPRDSAKPRSAFVRDVKDRQVFIPVKMRQSPGAQTCLANGYRVVVANGRLGIYTQDSLEYGRVTDSVFTRLRMSDYVLVGIAEMTMQPTGAFGPVPLKWKRRLSFLSESRRDLFYESDMVLHKEGSDDLYFYMSKTKLEYLDGHFCNENN